MCFSLQISQLIFDEYITSISTERVILFIRKETHSILPDSDLQLNRRRAGYITHNRIFPVEN